MTKVRIATVELTAIIVCCATLILAVTSYAGAAVRSHRKPVLTHVLTVTSQTLVFSTANGFPAVGGSAVTAGPVTSKPGGAGGEVNDSTVVSHPSAFVYVLKGTGVDYFAHGSLRSTVTSTLTLQADGSEDLTGTGKITGGTGEFKGDSGQFTFTGAAPSPTGVATLNSTGTLRHR